MARLSLYYLLPTYGRPYMTSKFLSSGVTNAGQMGALQWRSQECELGVPPLPCPLHLLPFPSLFLSPF